MQHAPASCTSESERLARLDELLVLDSAPEAVFDGLAQLASQLCGTPIALLSFVDGRRQWFKAHAGFPDVRETPREMAFCAHAIAADTLFEVPDATLDTRFCDNPLVTGAPDIRFYAGAPLTLPGGARVGTLCVIDRTPRHLDATQADALRRLAGIATQTLLMRQALLEKALAARSQYEQVLGESERQFRAIVEDQAELISLAKPDGELLYVNPAYARHFGRRPEQMPGMNLYKLVDESDRAAVRAQLAEVLRTGLARSGENRMVAIDGSIRWLAWTNGVQRDAQQQLQIHSVGRDITERKQAELALRASQSFLYRTGRVAGVGGWRLELASRRLSWSDETRRIHEVAADFEPSLETAMRFFPPEARPLLKAAVNGSITSGEDWDLELPMVTATGREIWVRAVGEVEFEGGKAVRLFGAFQDITERRALQQRLAESESFVRQITDNMPVRVAYFDAGLRFRFVNAALCQRYGLPREGIIGRTRDELIGAPIPTHLEPRHAGVLSGQAQRFEYDDPVNGSVRRIEVQLLPDLAPDGSVRGYYSIGVDITERSATERSLHDLTEILHNTTDLVAQADHRGIVTYINPAARRLAGLTLDEPLAHRHVSEFYPPATNRLFAETIMPAVRVHGVWLGETTVYGEQRNEVPVSHMMIAHRDASGRIARYSVMMRDISAAVAARQQLLLQTETLRSVMEAMPALVAVVGADSRYRYANDAYARWAGQAHEHIIGRTREEVLKRVDHLYSLPWMLRVLAGESVTFEKDQTGRQGAQHLLFSYTPLWLDDGRVDGFVAVAHDITPQKQEEGRLLLLSQRDALTGLLNRSGFEHVIEHRMRDGGSADVALLYIDLDHFKPVNDRHGHPVGDQVLRLFGQRLSALVRPTDAVARLGGDEFAVVLAGVREFAHVQAIADKVIDAAGTPFHIGALRLQIGASVGVATGAEHDSGWNELVARADAMLYRAKEGGRGRQASAPVRGATNGRSLAER